MPGSALQLNNPWQSLDEVELAMLDAAWQLGAWDMERQVRRACNDVAASAREALECRQALGDNPHAPGDERHLVAEAPDRELMHLGAQQGYVRWLFRPVRGGLWQMRIEDETLAADGSRPPPCPLRPQPARLGRSMQTVYRLGRSTRLVVA